MTLVINKYIILCGANVWQSKTAKDIEIFTLYTKFKKLRNENLKLVKKIFNKVMGDNTSRLNKNKSKRKKFKKNKKINNTKVKGKWAKTNTRQNKGGHRTKQANGNTYHWFKYNAA